MAIPLIVAGILAAGAVVGVTADKAFKIKKSLGRPEPSDRYNTEEAAQILGLSAFTVRQKIREFAAGDPKGLKATLDSGSRKGGYVILHADLMDFAQKSDRLQRHVDKYFAGDDVPGQEMSDEEAVEAILRGITDKKALEQCVAAYQDELELAEIEYERIRIETEGDDSKEARYRLLDAQKSVVELRSHIRALKFKLESLS